MQIFALSILATANMVWAAPKAVSLIETLTTDSGPVQLEVFAENLGVVWSLDFLPDSADFVFTEREGRLKIYRAAAKTFEDVKGLPPITARGQGGLLDVRVHPQFAKNALIFFSFTEADEKGRLTTVVARAELRGTELKNLKKILVADAWSDERIHFGSRLEFDGPDHLWVTVGDRNERDRVQSSKTHNGKVLRISTQGSESKQTSAEIYTLGHRSPQGLAKDSATGDLWLAEMGPRGGDEINRLQAGMNYGWPDVTHGREYYGPRIGQTQKKGTEPPVKFWVPSISPSGMLFYQGDAFPQWKGNIFLGTLSGQHIRRLTMKDRQVVGEEIWLKNKFWRFRSMRAGPKGEIYFSTDEGRLGRIVPYPASAKPPQK